MFSSGCSKKCGFVARIHASRKIFPGEISLKGARKRCADIRARVGLKKRRSVCAEGAEARPHPKVARSFSRGFAVFRSKNRAVALFQKEKSNRPSRFRGRFPMKALAVLFPYCRLAVNIVPIPTFSRRRRFAVEIQFDGPMDPGHIFRFVPVDVDVLPISLRAAVVIIGILRDEPRRIFEVYIVSKGADVKRFDALRHDDFIDLATPECPRLQALQIFGQDQQPFKRGAGKGGIFDHRQLIRQARGVKALLVEISGADILERLRKFKRIHLISAECVPPDIGDVLRYGDGFEIIAAAERILSDDPHAVGNGQLFQGEDIGSGSEKGKLRNAVCTGKDGVFFASELIAADEMPVDIQHAVDPGAFVFVYAGVCKCALFDQDGMIRHIHGRQVGAKTERIVSDPLYFFGNGDGTQIEAIIKGFVVDLGDVFAQLDRHEGIAISKSSFSDISDGVADRHGLHGGQTDGAAGNDIADDRNTCRPLVFFNIGIGHLKQIAVHRKCEKRLGFCRVIGSIGIDRCLGQRVRSDLQNAGGQFDLLQFRKKFAAIKRPLSEVFQTGLYFDIGQVFAGGERAASERDDVAGDDCACQPARGEGVASDLRDCRGNGNGGKRATDPKGVCTDDLQTFVQRHA